MDRSVRVIKRALDVLGAGFGFALLLPLYPLIALAIYLDSPGPVFIRQRRAGRLLEVAPPPGGGSPRPVFHEFEMVKFRSMRPDAEKHTGPVLATKDDPRITRVGRFLRRTRLDEIPQFLNVLRGDMSLVGPRPERPDLAQQLALAIPYFEERMRGVKPGITGLAQVNLGYSGKAPPESAVAAFEKELTNPFQIDDAQGALADDMRLKLLFDLAYCAAAENLRTYLPLELSILAKTPLVMILRRGT
jgi:lipopolysaccharide/colanic/teichoic acid biosynthesis glycosyltransferase